MTIRELKAEIKKLTDWTPKSTDRRYLERRLEEIKERLARGEDVRHRASNHSVVSVSMPTSASEAVDRILEKESEKRGGSMGKSELVRAALAKWAASNGYKAEAALIGDS